MTPEEYFKKWSEDCRIFTDYKPIHSHEDMMQFAKDYHTEQLRLQNVVVQCKHEYKYYTNEYVETVAVCSKCMDAYF